MCRRMIYLILLVALFAGAAQAQFITSAVNRNTDSDATELPVIAPDPLAENSVTFVDRTHVYADIPESILGAQYIMLANDNKNFSAYELDLTFAVNSTLYVFVDNRMVGGSDGPKGMDPDISGMAWLTDMGFVDTEEDIGIDESFDGSINQYFSIFALSVTAGTVTIHGNTEGHGGNMLGVAALGPKLSAYNPTPKDGSMRAETWVSLGWAAGDTADTHDVYFSDNFDDVNDGTGDAFRGNQALLYLIAGFAGVSYPDGLVPGTTYYWRVDEIEADGVTMYRGNIWSFTVPPKTAYEPVPADGSDGASLNAQLSWTTGFGAKLHYVFFGEDFDEVNNATEGVPNGTTTYTPASLKLAKTYYWRVDEFDALDTYKGEVWSFTTEGAVSGPNPANGAVGVSPTVILGWDAGAVAASHEVYFGADADAVKNATKTSPEYKGPKALGEESYDPGKLILNTAYYWRIDEANGASTDSPWAGNVWSFTTGDYFVIDDFEIYDANDNQIWYSWHDGLGYGVPGVGDYFAGNGTGGAVGDESTASYTEETIVRPGSLQSMPLVFDNNKQGYSKYSEVELTLSDVRDWTAEGVAELSIWFRGNAASVGSFVEGPIGTYTMTATGADIWNDADEFHYAFKTLTGAGSIIAKVESVEQANDWSKAGVMVRDTLAPGSKFAAVYITPTDAADGTSTNGCTFQGRLETDVAAISDSAVRTDEQRAIIAPYWVKIERDVAGNFRASFSADGSTWRQMSWNPQSISMNSTAYIGLALTSHDNALTCEAVFSNVAITGNVSGQWAHQDIGIVSNAAEPLYVAVSNSTGVPAVVVNIDPAAANNVIWTEWVIPLQAFADQGINLTNVDRVAIGLGTQGNISIPGGSGTMYIDDVRLYLPSEATE